MSLFVQGPPILQWGLQNGVLALGSHRLSSGTPLGSPGVDLEPGTVPGFIHDEMEFLTRNLVLFTLPIDCASDNEIEVTLHFPYPIPFEGIEPTPWAWMAPVAHLSGGRG
jgi:hypothetical protein